MKVISIQEQKQKKDKKELQLLSRNWSYSDTDYM